jgi:monothiol glutaredoxin
MNTPPEVAKQITDDLSRHKIMLYVKGNREMPQCGFSKAVIDVFDFLQVPYETRDVLSDPNLRDGIKQFTQWPTIPQVFIEGKFVGGCDIVRDLFQKGELEKMVQKFRPA